MTKDPPSLKKSSKIIERKLTILNSSKMKTLINAAQARHAIPAGLMQKREPSRNHRKNKMQSSN